MEPKQRYLALCVNRRLTGTTPSCGGSGAESLVEQLEQAMRQHGITLPLQRSDCLGQCQQGPNLRLAPEGQVLNLHNRIDLDSIIAWLKLQLA